MYFSAARLRLELIVVIQRWEEGKAVDERVVECVVSTREGNGLAGRPRLRIANEDLVKDKKNSAPSGSRLGGEDLVPTT